MSLVPDLYPGDGLIAAAAIVLSAISITTVIALFAARFWSRRPTVRYPILFAGLVSCVITPLITTAVRVSGTSTFAWHVLPARPLAGLAPQERGVDPALAEFLATVFAADDPPAGLDGQSEETAAEPAVVPAVASTRGKPPSANRDSTRPIDLATTTGRDMLRGAATLAFAIWLVGIVVRIVYLAGGSLHVMGIWRSGRPFFAPRRQAAVAGQLRRLLGIGRLPTILISDAVQSPFATGCIRGTVILPSGLVGRLSTEQLCDVLIHECAHVMRRDPTVMLLQVIARSLFWPIPWVHWLSRELTCACEEICDNYVLGHRDPVQYAETLLHVATLVGGPRREAAWVGMLQWPGRLELRITGLIDHDRSKATRIGRLGPGLCLVALLLTSVAICGMTVRPRPADAAVAGATNDPAADAAPASDTSPAGTSTAKSNQEQRAEEKSDGKSSQPNATNPPSTAHTDIDVWFGPAGAMGQAYRQQVGRFNESQPGIHVKVRTFNSYGALQTELERALKEGHPPDLAVVEIHQIAGLAAAGNIVPLDSFMASDPEFHSDDFLTGIMANLRYQDKPYAVPVSRSMPILYYNKDRFAAAGLDPEKPPTTWEELRDMADSLTFGGQYGFLATNSAWAFESLVWSNGGELIVDGKPAFANAGAGPLQLWADMVRIDETARYSESGGGEFGNGRAAMTIDSSMVLHWMRKNPKFRLGAAFLPTTVGGRVAAPTGGGAAVILSAIPRERQAAAWAFARWSVATEQAARWSQMSGYMPVRESARVLLEKEGLYDDYPNFAVAVKQLQFAREAPQLPHWGASWPMIAEAMTAIVRDGAPALETLQDCERRVARLLETGIAPQTDN